MRLKLFFFLIGIFFSLLKRLVFLFPLPATRPMAAVAATAPALATA